MELFLNSIIILGVIILIARVIKRHVKIFQKYFIPSSLIAGIIGLILGPQVIGLIPSGITIFWSKLPKDLIIIVFAGLFIGKNIPKAKKIWKSAAPMISFGMIIAWGHYVIGILLTIFILIPFFNANPLTASLIEISFQGGHGTVAGLSPTFEQLGFSEGTDIGLALATLSLIVAIVSGIFFVNMYNRKNQTKTDFKIYKKQKESMIKSGYNFYRLSSKLEKNPNKLFIHVILFASAIAIGWLILKGLVNLEAIFLQDVTELRFLAYLPLFPLAMIGGLIVQLILKKIKRQNIVDKNIVHNFSTIALDFLIASAIATVSLHTIIDNFGIFLILGFSGIIWILICFILLAPIIFRKYWFENGITNIGQAMGVTATGLLLNRLADPSNKTRVKEVFGYKQLVFEMFMGGGIITAISAVVIFQLGLVTSLIISSGFLIFFILLSLYHLKSNKE
ncbi:MAG: sodium/glutamate symporter [Candidatus Woesearchaeota archaeon]